MIDVLKLVKFDLNRCDDKLDEYLTNRINAAKKEIEREGIKLNLEDEDHALVVADYASWLYRKRAQDIAFPRSLRYRLNNILISQKAGEDK